MRTLIQSIFLCWISFMNVPSLNLPSDAIFAVTQHIEGATAFFPQTYNKYQFFIVKLYHSIFTCTFLVKPECQFKLYYAYFNWQLPEKSRHPTVTAIWSQHTNFMKMISSHQYEWTNESRKCENCSNFDRHGSRLHSLD